MTTIPSSPPVGVLQTFNREQVIAVATVVVFVASCKMYNIFIAAPTESYSDVDIAKFAILGVFSVFATRAAITTLFEQPIDLGAAVGIQSLPSAPVSPPPAVGIPALTKLVR